MMRVYECGRCGSLRPLHVPFLDHEPRNYYQFCWCCWQSTIWVAVDLELVIWQPDLDGVPGADLAEQPDLMAEGAD